MLPAGGDPCKTPWLSPPVHVASMFISLQQLLHIPGPGMRDETLPELTHLPTSLIPVQRDLPTSLILITQCREVPSYVLLVAFLVYRAYRSPGWRDRDPPNKDLTAGSGMTKAS